MDSSQSVQELFVAVVVALWWHEPSHSAPAIAARTASLMFVAGGSALALLRTLKPIAAVAASSMITATGTNRFIIIILQIPLPSCAHARFHLWQHLATADPNGCSLH